jgi:hypothetical protein
MYYEEITDKIILKAAEQNIIIADLFITQYMEGKNFGCYTDTVPHLSHEYENNVRSFEGKKNVPCYYSGRYKVSVKGNPYDLRLLKSMPIRQGKECVKCPFEPAKADMLFVAIRCGKKVDKNTKETIEKNVKNITMVDKVLIKMK